MHKGRNSITERMTVNVIYDAISTAEFA